MANFGEFYQIRVWSYTLTQAAVNVRHFRVTNVSGISPTDTEVAERCNTLWAAPYKALISANATYRGVQAQIIMPQPPKQAGSTIASSGVGGVAGDMVPGMVSGIIKTVTSLAGRKYRGRIYIPWVAEADNGPTGIPTAGYVTRLTTLASEMVNVITVTGGLGTLELTPILPGKTLIPGSNPPKYVLDGTHTNITGYTARTIWASQRRRGDFGRPNTSPI